MRVLAEAAMFTGLALALHLGGLAAVASLGGGGIPAAGSGGREMITLEGGGPAARALAARWSAPPEAGPAPAEPAMPAAEPAAPIGGGVSASRAGQGDPVAAAASGAATGALSPSLFAPPVAVDAAPRNIPRHVRARPDLAAETATLARPAGLGDAAGPPGPPDGRARHDRPPKLTASLAPAPEPRDGLPMVGAPASAPPARLDRGSPRPVARPESRPGPRPLREAPPAQPASQPSLTAAGAGGGAAAGAKAADVTTRAATDAGRTRLLAVWGGRIRADVERRKHYPRAAAGAEGTAVLRIAVAADGRLRAAALRRSAGHPALDDAALGAVRGARFPPAPEGLGPGPHEFTFQMTFAQ